MDAKDLDNLDLDLNKYYDFENHNHCYNFYISKGRLIRKESKTAPTYEHIAQRFESAIEWVKWAKTQDKEPDCPKCGQGNNVARTLILNVMTGEELEYVLHESHGGLDWNETIRWLKWAVKCLRKLPEPPGRCPACGTKPKHKVKTALRNTKK